jgi:hypothetical protein
MPNGITSYAAGVWLPMLFGIGVPPTQYWVGLTSAAPLASYDGTTVMAIEPQGGAYARQVVGTGASYWSVDSNGVLSNVGDIAFPVPSADWGYLTHVIVCSNAGAGQLYAYGELRNPQNVMQAIAVDFPPGALVLTMPLGG